MKLRHFDDDPQQEVFRKIFANIEDLYDRVVRISKQGGQIAYSENDHARLHTLNDTADHNGVTGATLNNIATFDANGLPKDSGTGISEVGTAIGDRRFSLMLAAD